MKNKKKQKIKIIKKEHKFTGRAVSLDVVEFKFKNKRLKAEIVDFPNTVGVLPLLGKNKIVLIRQYRFPAQKELWEIPAGKVDKGEQPKEAAKRELKEETGFKAGRLEKIGEFYVSPGYTKEYMHLFRASMLKKGEQSLDETEGEVINRVKIFDLQESLKMIKEKKIIDVKTILSIVLECFNCHFLKK